jgi:glutaredoxin
LKEHLRKNNIRFTDIDVSKDQAKAQELVRKTGQQGVPQTDINGQYVLGFDKKRVNELLGIKG